MIIHCPPEDPFLITKNVNNFICIVKPEKNEDKCTFFMSFLEEAENFNDKLFLCVKMSKFQEFSRKFKLAAPGCICRVENGSVKWYSCFPTKFVFSHQIEYLSDVDVDIIHPIWPHMVGNYRKNQFRAIESGVRLKPIKFPTSPEDFHEEKHNSSSTTSSITLSITPPITPTRTLSKTPSITPPSTPSKTPPRTPPKSRKLHIMNTPGMLSNPFGSLRRSIKRPVMSPGNKISVNMVELSISSTCRFEKPLKDEKYRKPICVTIGTQTEKSAIRKHRNSIDCELGFKPKGTNGRIVSIYENINESDSVWPKNKFKTLHQNNFIKALSMESHVAKKH